VERGPDDTFQPDRGDEECPQALRRARELLFPTEQQESNETELIEEIVPVVAPRQVLVLLRRLNRRLLREARRPPDITDDSSAR
jgi:hypothetical protein